MRAVFLTGPGRTGTTVLREALRVHPDVAAGRREPRFIVDPGGLLDLHDALHTRWDPYVADDALYRFRTVMSRMQIKNGTGDLMDTLYKDLNVTFSGRRWFGMEVTREVMHDARPGDRSLLLQEYAKNVMRVSTNRPFATHFVDDTPYSGLHADRIRRVFGNNVFFIHCIRHPLDTLASHIHGRAGWTARDPETAARTILAVHSRLLAYERFTQDLFLRVRLEDVLMKPVQTMKDVCGVVGLSRLNAEEIATAYDPDHAHVGRRAELRLKEVDIARPILGPLCATLGYEEDV